MSSLLKFCVIVKKIDELLYALPIPVAARSKAWVGGRSLAGDYGFESCRGHECLSVVSVVSCQVEVSATS